ncbi:structural maintenance of chromosomes protein 3 isoform X1 [Histomonas meleagridis]|uniref:structural maintenance of chromosomes protein 3 isoform X1 n=1 Tax=Histomonas meleagridis TaxID=135588 RepID=UPI00355A04CA|nr:structural maintenance of chromosomes protein 3 isoform X1 [Histomonas meleagridis]KAH0799423.1 structural maintenance of chromosomes protein 3 isoform X1 [Histomonas meleagridis]
MYLKRVTISGFKAFGDTVVFGDFSCQKNCIFGLNGSGKSTFFNAIEFVLLEDFAHIQPHDRGTLLHTGSLTGFVELTFDNTSRRFQIESDEVSIRRSIGHKKDELFVNKKHITRQDMVNLFEIARISLKSGLFIIKQGAVKAISEMKEDARLQLLYDVTGIRFYDEQREESIKMMGEASIRKEKIQQSITEIEERLDQLQEEAEELRSYNQLDRKRKALEYCVYDIDRSNTDKTILNIENQITQENSVIDKLREELENISNQRTEIEQNINEKKEIQKQILLEQNQREHKKEKLIKRKTRMQFKMETLTKKKQDSDQNFSKVSNQLEKLNSKKQRKENIYNEYTQECDNLLTEKMKLEALIPSKSNAIDEVHQQIQNIEKELSRSHVSEYEYELDNLNQQVSDLEEQQNQQKEQYQIIKEELKSLQNDRINSMNRKKELWKLDNQIKIQQRGYSSKTFKAQQDYEHLMSSSVSKAMQYIRKYYQERNEQPPPQVIDILEFDESLDLSIDAVAKGKLFYLIVEDDIEASDILEHLIRYSDGRISIIALNKLRSNRKEIERTEQYCSLCEEIRCEEKYIPVIDYLFGSYALCSTINVASDISTTNNINCVTLVGDLIYSSGPLIGGYIPLNRSICKSKRKIEHYKLELNELDETLRKTNEEIEEIENNQSEINKIITQKSSDQFKIESKIKSIQNEINNIQNKISKLNNQLQNENEMLNSKEKMLFSLRQKENLILEKENENNLSEDEIKEIRERISNISIEYTMKMLQTQQIKCEINDNIIPQIKKLTKDKEELDSFKLKNQIEETIQELQSIENEDEINTQQSNESEETLNLLQQELQNLEKDFEHIKKLENSTRKKISTEQKIIQDFNKQLSLNQEKKDNIIQKISSILPYPEEEANEYKNKSYTQLMEEMDNINTELQSYRHVNKKAYDQFHQFNNKRKELHDRQKEIIDGEESITSLIAKLDQQKENAILESINKVSENFSKIYQILEGKNANIILKKQKLDDNFYNDEEESTTIVGIGIEVDGKNLEEMSGGERTIVAISLLFAIQQMDPSPFYFFDEIDSDLDEEHRIKLANFIDNMSNIELNKENAVQFVYATHRRDLMLISDKFFAVIPEHSQSKVKMVTKDEAEDYITKNT